jgi:ribosomal protein L7/L12
MKPIDEQQEQRIYEALYAGRKIEAIKLHRMASGAGLKESKDFIDALEAQLRSEAPERFAAPVARRVGCAGAVVVIAAASIARLLINLK